MNIALLGYGKMGKTIENLALRKGHSIVFKKGKSSSEGNLSDAEVAIEFSSPEAAVENISQVLANNIPVVSGTTGWLEKYDQIVHLCESKNGCFVYASNFSIGVNLFFGINKYAANLMASYAEYQVEVEEIHHLEKKDAPSGTAISIAKDILEHSWHNGWQLDGEDPHKLKITAKREADIKGTHIVSYNSPIDRIVLKHEAHSRDGFALGALLAAEWSIGRKGVYSMKDVLGI